jgi:hypothetical protein
VHATGLAMQPASISKRKKWLIIHPTFQLQNGWIDETIPVHVPYTWNLNQSIGYESIYVTVVGAVLA